MNPNFIIEIQNNDIGMQIQDILDSESYFYFNIDEHGRLLKRKYLWQSDNRNECF